MSGREDKRAPGGPDGASDDGLTETRIDSQNLCDGQFLHLRRDTVRLPDGQQAVREYVVHPGAVAIVPLLDDGAGGLRVVLERQFRYPVGRVMIEVPAGKLDPGEDPWLCAQRELAEETGYRAGEMCKVGAMHLAIAYSTEVIHVYFAKGLVAGPTRLDQGEFVQTFDAAPNELFSWCREGLVTDAKTLTCAFWLQSWLAGGWDLPWHRTSD